MTASSQYSQGVLSVEILDPVKTIYKPWSVFLEKWRDSCIMEIQLLEDRRGVSGIIFKAKTEDLGNYLYFDIWKNFIYQAFIIHQVFKLQVWKLILSFLEWPLSNCSNFLLCLSLLHKMDTADVICLTAVRLLSWKLKQIMLWSESRLLEKVNLEWSSVMSKQGHMGVCLVQSCSVPQLATLLVESQSLLLSQPADLLIHRKL